MKKYIVKKKEKKQYPNNKGSATTTHSKESTKSRGIFLKCTFN
jgi:hypothetical protein